MLTKHSPIMACFNPLKFKKEEELGHSSKSQKSHVFDVIHNDLIRFPLAVLSEEILEKFKILSSLILC